MGAKMYYSQMFTLFICFILLLVSYANNDGNIKFEMTFTITEQNTMKFGLLHRQLEYGVNDDLWETPYNDMDLALVVDRIFVDSGSLSEAVLNQLIDLTAIYADNLVEDVTADMSLSQDQKNQLTDYITALTPDYEANMDEIMGDISFADSLNVSDETNDAFRLVEIPSMLVGAGMALCIVMMILLSMFYFGYLTETCCCKCCTSFLCLIPALFAILVCGVTWIVLASLYEAHVNINWDDAESGLKNGIDDVMTQYFVDPVTNFLSDNGINYNGLGTVLDATIAPIGNFEDKVSVGTSPWLQSIAGLLFFMFACGFCCCQTKKEDEAKQWDEGVEFGSYA